jgi:hypothetical protein
MKRLGADMEYTQKKKILTHISAIRWLVRLDIQDKYGFYPGLKFGDDHEVYKMFVSLYPDFDKVSRALPEAAEQALLAAAESDFKDMYLMKRKA